MKWLQHRWVMIALGCVGVCGAGYLVFPYAVQAYLNHRVYVSTVGLPVPDRAEVSLLGPLKMDNSSPLKDGFPIRGYGNAMAPIIDTQTLDSSQARHLAELWRSQTFAWELQMLCHSPVYGVRFFSRDKLLFETSICFHCSNFYISDPLLEAGWWGFDIKKPEAKSLYDYLNGLIPVEKRKKKGG